MGIIDDVKKAFEVELSDTKILEIDDILKIKFKINSKYFIMQIPRYKDYFNFINDVRELIIIMELHNGTLEIKEIENILVEANHTESTAKQMEKIGELLKDYENLLVNKVLVKKLHKIMKKYFTFGNIFDKLLHNDIITFREFKKECTIYQWIYIIGVIVNMRYWLKKKIQEIKFLMDMEETPLNSPTRNTTNNSSNFGANTDSEAKETVSIPLI